MRNRTASRTPEWDIGFAQPGQRLPESIMSGVTVPHVLKLAALSAILAATLVRAIERPSVPTGLSARPVATVATAS